MYAQRLGILAQILKECGGFATPSLIAIAVGLSPSSPKSKALTTPPSQGAEARCPKYNTMGCDPQPLEINWSCCKLIDHIRSSGEPMRVEGIAPRTIPLTPALIERLRACGVTTHHAPGAPLPNYCFFEPPCSFKWMQVSHSLSLGAFSYAVSGFYNACSIGRYVSIGEEVQVGRQGHPTNWASTSPIFYQPYQGALNLDLPAAAGVTPETFLLGKQGEQQKYTRIGNDVYVGHGAFIMAGVSIGDGAIIGANAVVTRDVPSYAIAAGVPATVRRMRFSEDIIERMLKCQWWRFAFWDLKGASVTQPNEFLDTVERRIADGLQEYKAQVLSLEELAAPAAR